MSKCHQVFYACSKVSYVHVLWISIRSYVKDLEYWISKAPGIIVFSSSDQQNAYHTEKASYFWGVFITIFEQRCGTISLSNSVPKWQGSDGNISHVMRGAMISQWPSGSIYSTITIRQDQEHRWPVLLGVTLLSSAWICFSTWESKLRMKPRVMLRIAVISTTIPMCYTKTPFSITP